MFNVGIIGLGHVAAHQVAAIGQSTDFQLAAGCDPDESRHSLLGESTKAFVSAEQMLAESDLDVVVVASPNSLHVEHGMQVMAAGKWLLMEKPLAETQAELERFAARKDELGAHCVLALHAAFGPEVEWYCDEGRHQLPDGLAINSFVAEFDDPYVVDDKLLPQAASLGGSWMDSGINALSVLGRVVDVSSLAISDAIMTRSADCLERKGHVEFDWAGKSGTGVIDTSWVSGRDKKVTTFGFANSDVRLVLDHSEQQAILCSPEGRQVMYSCENGLPRLTNHYVGVFRDLAARLQAGEDNFEYCRILHHLLYAAENHRR